MRNRLSLALSLALLSLPAQAKPPVLGALFSLTVMDKGVERKVDPKETLPAGSKVLIHVEAQHQPCTILTSGYLEGKKTLPPSLHTLKPAEQASSEFSLKQPLKAGQLFVVVLPQHSGVTRELSQLVDKWKAKPDGTAPTAVHDRLNGWISKQDKDSQLPYPKSRGLSIASEAPVDPYDWHDEADGLRFSPDQPRVFVYQLGQP